MKVNIFFVIMVFLISCKNDLVYENPETKLVDKYHINTDYTYYEVGNMRYCDSNSFLCFNKNQKCLKTYTKSKTGIFNCIDSFRIPIKSNFYSYVRLSKDKFVLIDSKNIHYIFENNRFIRKYLSLEKKKFLKNSFYYLDDNAHQLIYLDSIFIGTYFHGSLDNLMKYFSEPSICEYKFKNDEIIKIRDYLIKPHNLKDFRAPFPCYSFVDNSIFIIYPCFDTIYIYDRNKQIEQKVHINNKDFKMPEKFSYNRFFGDDSRSYDTEYKLKNFQYSAIFYKSKSDHFLLFYYTPVKKGETFQTLKLIVIDRDFKNPIYYEFSGQEYYDTHTFIVISDKGIAMPLLQNNPNEDEKDIFYHVYNF
jgi:hypothetical protein